MLGLTGHTNFVSRSAFSPASKRLLTRETKFNNEPSLAEFEIEAKVEAEEEEIIQRLVLIFQELTIRGP